MARKSVTLTIGEGRDQGKVFRLTEWSALQTERWILRAVFGLGKAGVEIPPEILQLGAAATAYAIASQASKLPSRLGLKLSDELMECVKRVEATADRSLVENDIEDVSTRLRLKSEVLKLTFGFFVFAASPSSAPPVSGTPTPKP
jgi:hypothetical protein